MSGTRSLNLEGPDSWRDVQAALRVLRSLFAVGIMAVLRIAEMAALISSVLGILWCSSMLPPMEHERDEGAAPGLAQVVACDWEEVDVGLQQLKSWECSLLPERVLRR